MFWKDTLERVVRTAIQAAAAAVLLYLTGAVGDGGWDAIDWQITWKAGAAAGLLALLTAVAARPVGDKDSASLLKRPV